MIRLLSPDDECTRRFGAALARTLPRPPTRSLRIFLKGDLGAGKTTFVRGLLQALGETRTVKSPTYSLLETYERGPWRIVHLDLYRLAEPRDLVSLGLPDHDHEGALWLIEWPERGEGVLPQPDLELVLEGSSTGHWVSVEARTPLGAEWLHQASREPEFSSAEH
ncbi:MAG: tRNA (adenosine(37)-N6)-threonylcarbamoyltransferase complex ATPase subunit type 1 TsaE [Gammaproteobacteria bacterium]|nr:tRNA (adenosine(37)-N6)-threonylcarbamoyltransferase complex ATPase subunit type 1 TsaE [Gammaproteobacteria bacterium]